MKRYHSESATPAQVTREPAAILESRAKPFRQASKTYSNALLLQHNAILHFQRFLELP